MKKLGLALVVLLAACSSGGGSSSTPTTREAKAEDVKNWPKQWCAAAVGDTRQRVIDLMGPPTGTELEAGDPADDEWRGFGHLYIAFYGADGKVRQLDVNNVPDAVRPLACEDVRT